MKLTATKAYREEARRSIAGGVNSNARFGILDPLCVESGAGAILTDVDGNRYVDYLLGLGTVILGHAEATVTGAVANVASIGQTFASLHPLELKFAKLLQQRVPSAELVRFGGSGSEMVQAALRVARAFTGRRKIVKFEGHYHGWYDNVLVNHTGPANDPSGPVPFPLHLQSEGQSRAAAEDTHVLPWNHTEALLRYLTVHGGDVAAMIMEPVMCNTGVISPQEDYLHAIKAACAQYGIVLIFDEVITGFRLSPGGAQEKFGVSPDLSIFAKALANGFPLAVLAGRADIMDMIGTRKVNHSGTYNANLMSMAAGIATLNQLAADTGAAYRRIESAGMNLIKGIREIAARRGSNLQVTGYPSVFHTFFTDRPQTIDYFSYRQSDAQRLKKFLIALNDEGVRVSSRGTWFVSAAHTARETEFTLEAIDRVLAAL